MKLFTKSKPLTRSEKILKTIKKYGQFGAPNYVLARQDIGGLNWRARISEMRKDGINIIPIRTRLPNGKASDTYRYILIDEDKSL